VGSSKAVSRNPGNKNKCPDAKVVSKAVAANRAAKRSPVNSNSSPDARVASKVASRAVAVNSKIDRLGSSQIGNPPASSLGDFCLITYFVASLIFAR